ncbi:unnamed protein product, partial [Rotaria magnacalcarata]
DEGRGGNGNHHEIFYNIFPKLETDAKVFTIESCSRKSTDFTGTDLANYVHAKFNEITQTEKLNDVLVRSEDSCRIDLLRLGAQFQPNIQSPYFEVCTSSSSQSSTICSSITNCFSEFESDEQSTSFRTRAVLATSGTEDVVVTNNIVNEMIGTTIETLACVAHFRTTAADGTDNDVDDDDDDGRVVDDDDRRVDEDLDHGNVSSITVFVASH